MKAVRAMETCLYEKELIMPGEGEEKSNPGIIRLESSLLTLGSLGNVCHGLFYMLPVELGDCVMIRYIESGCYQGFFKIAEQHLQDKFGEKHLLPWKVYTDLDLKLEAPSKLPSKSSCTVVD